jgi:hypothetical protein
LEAKIIGKYFYDIIDIEIAMSRKDNICKEIIGDIIINLFDIKKNPYP